MCDVLDPKNEIAHCVILIDCIRVLNETKDTYQSCHHDVGLGIQAVNSIQLIEGAPFVICLFINRSGRR